MKRSESREPKADGAVNESAIGQPSVARRQDAHGTGTWPAAVDRGVAEAVRWACTGGPAWRFGRHSVYRLPWYLVIGEPGAGKATILRASGFRPGQRELDAAAACGVSLRWWFGDDAVLFETPIDDAAAKGSVLLQRLKRARRRCAINGIIVMVSAEHMMGGDEAARLHRSDAVRAGIAQAYRIGKRRVPVYVLVTHGDRLTGFDAFVGDMSEAAPERRLGVVFPLNAEPADSVGFTQAFDVLVRGVRRHLIARFPIRADPRRAAMAYRFPGSLAQLAAPLSRFVRAVFDATPQHAESVLLRAVDFSALPTNDLLTSGGQSAHAPIDTSVRQPIGFGARFLRDVVLSERDLVLSHHAVPRGRAVLLRVAAASTVALAACVGVALFTAYSRGSAAVAATASPARELLRAAQSGVDTRAPRAMLTLLDAARGLPCAGASQDPASSWRPGLERMGEMRLDRACRAAYRTVLRETLQPYVVARLSETLEDARHAPSVQYAALRVYSMLGDSAHYDRAAVLAWVKAQATDRAFSPNERASWVAHAAAWFGQRSLESALTLDASLVARARVRLLAQPAAQRVFRGILSDLESALPEPLSVADMGGPGAALVFYRKSTEPLSDGVPGAFTLAGMHRYFALRDAAVAQAQAESWVLGPAGAFQMQTLGDELDRLYFARYVAAWDAIIGDVGLRPLSSSGDGVAMIELLASGESPLRAFLDRAAKETTLAVAATAPSTTTASMSRPSSGVTGALRRWLGATTSPADTRRRRDAKPRMQVPTWVDRHFEALHRLVQHTNTDVGTPLDRARAQLKEVAVYLKAAALARGSGLLAPPDDALARLARNAAGLPAPLGDMLAGFAREGAEAARATERARIDEHWRADVSAFCHAAVDGRYPFVDDASIDVTLDDFARLFAPGGLLDAFFQSELKSYVDTTRSPWIWRVGVASPGMSIAALRAFERAARIREVFFPVQGTAMDVRFTLTPHRTDVGVARMTVVLSGQTMTYAGGPPPTTAFKWPDRTARAHGRIAYRPAGKDEDHIVQAHGAWSMFRVLDQGRFDAHTPDRFGLTYAFPGHSVEMELAASSVINPFEAQEWRAFRCPSGL